MEPTPPPPPDRPRRWSAARISIAAAAGLAIVGLLVAILSRVGDGGESGTSEDEFSQDDLKFGGRIVVAGVTGPGHLDPIQARQIAQATCKAFDDGVSTAAIARTAAQAVTDNGWDPEDFEIVLAVGVDVYCPRHLDKL